MHQIHWVSRMDFFAGKLPTDVLPTVELRMQGYPFRKASKIIQKKIKHVFFLGGWTPQNSPFRTLFRMFGGFRKMSVFLFYVGLHKHINHSSLTWIRDIQATGVGHLSDWLDGGSTQRWPDAGHACWWLQFYIVLHLRLVVYTFLPLFTGWMEKHIKVLISKVDIFHIFSD